MKREREINLLRKKKKLIKKYSDFELGLLASEINDYTYLLKSIKFPIDKYKITAIKKEKEEDKELLKMNKNNKKEEIITLEELTVIEDEKEKKVDDDEEYNGLKVKEKEKKNKNKKKRK